MNFLWCDYTFGQKFGSGKILLQTKMKINKNSLPIHIIRSTNKIYIRLIKIFIKTY